MCAMQQNQTAYNIQTIFSKQDQRGLTRGFDAILNLGRINLVISPKGGRERNLVILREAFSFFFFLMLREEYSAIHECGEV